ncbi:hypothetical protein R6Q59_005529 [Mikania micrantha]
MDSNTKMRKGFMKGKLVMSFYRASKPSTNMQPYTAIAPTKTVKTSHNTTTHMKPSSLIMNQEKVNPPPVNHRVSYVIPQTMSTYGVFDNPYGVVVDEGVDAKAATYISCVQERFKLEHAY